MKRILAALLAVMIIISLTGCIAYVGDVGIPEGEYKPEETLSLPGEVPEHTADPVNPPPQEPVEEDGYYYDLENVVLYLHIYDRLPENYVTKAEARDMGWEGGSVEKYIEGAAIGGDSFGNREGLLPKAEWRKYTECDLDTDGAESRGAKRLVFSNDGLYFYTDDHYESFTEVIVEGREVVLK